jgi:hypothetical protein
MPEGRSEREDTAQGAAADAVRVQARRCMPTAAKSQATARKPQATDAGGTDSARPCRGRPVRRPWSRAAGAALTGAVSLTWLLAVVREALAVLAR